MYVETLSFFGECSSCTDRQILSCSKLCTTVAEVYKSCQTVKAEVGSPPAGVS